MKPSKQHLINSLTTAIHALTNGIVKHDWKTPSCCNCGIMVQAVLNDSKDDVVKHVDRLQRMCKDGLNPTWKNFVVETCSVTGKSMPEIFRKLEAAGLSREDIVHLEYLENPAILEKSGIEKIRKVKKEQIDTKIVVKEYTKSHFIFWKKKYTKEEKVPVYQESFYFEYERDYYVKKENLIKYLVAWKKILESEIDTSVSHKNQLHAKLLNAVAEENYEEAAVIRDELATLA